MVGGIYKLRKKRKQTQKEKKRKNRKREGFEFFEEFWARHLAFHSLRVFLFLYCYFAIAGALSPKLSSSSFLCSTLIAYFR
jgi:hypothetical protein